MDYYYKILFSQILSTLFEQSENDSLGAGNIIDFIINDLDFGVLFPNSLFKNLPNILKTYKPFNEALKEIKLNKENNYTLKVLII